MDRLAEVERCSRCLLPSSMPGSNFNEEGECAWCQSGFPDYAPLGEEKLAEVLQRWRNPAASADCLVGISGGKDSSYAALQLTRIFGMRVEAFSYVHDAMSEFAIENARKVCRALEIKQHLVSLSHHKHLESFTAFFEAWLESGNAVAAGAACVACKHIHLLGTRLASERGIPMVVWADCPLENPPLARSQTGDRKSSTNHRIRELMARAWQQLCVDGSFRKAFLKYAPTCILGGLSLRPEGIYLRLRYPRVRHIHFYDYQPWDRAQIIAALQAHTSWTTPDTLPSDWHSDCQLHILREYMYQRMLGATEVDCHLSNQIRHGMMTREQGWCELVKTKSHHALVLPEVLSRLGLQRLLSRLDPTCFEIEDEGSACVTQAAI